MDHAILLTVGCEVLQDGRVLQVFVNACLKGIVIVDGEEDSVVFVDEFKYLVFDFL